LSHALSAQSSQLAANQAQLDRMKGLMKLLERAGHQAVAWSNNSLNLNNPPIPSVVQHLQSQQQQQQQTTNDNGGNHPEATSNSRWGDLHGYDFDLIDSWLAFDGVAEHVQAMVPNTAINAVNKDDDNNTSSDKKRLLLGEALPEWLWLSDKVIGRDGSKVLVAMPALLDVDAATPEEHAEAVFSFLEANLSHCSLSVGDEEQEEEEGEGEEKALTIVIDTRSVEGGCNPSSVSTKMLSIVRELFGVIAKQQFRDAVKRVIVFPVPHDLKLVMTAAMLFIDKATANKTMLVLGDPKKGDMRTKCPAEVEKFVDLNGIDAADSSYYGREDIERACKGGRWNALCGWNSHKV
jgi:hypothetical protein